MTFEKKKPKETFRTPGKKRRRQKGTGSIYRRADGQWGGYLSLGTGPDGKPRRTRPVYGVDYEDVDRKLAELKKDLETGGQLDRSVTVEAWMDYWIENIAKPRLMPDTYVTNRGHVRNQINPFIGKRKLSELSPEDVRYMHKKILEKWLTQTCRNSHLQLSKALDDAMKERPPKVKYNVAKLVDTPTATVEDRGALDADQARHLLVTSYNWGDPLLTRWLFALLTGARQAECLGLRDEFIDFDNMLIDISWQLKRIKLKPGSGPDDPDRFDVRPGVEFIPLYRGYVLRRTKTKKPRVAPMPEPLALIMRAYLAARPPNEYGLVWVSEQGRPIRPEDDRDAWYDALSRADLPRLVLHAARSTAATLLADLDIDEQTRMQILGHSSTAAHRGYRHVNLTEAGKGMEKLAALLSVEG